MNIQKVCIYEVEMTKRGMKYAVSQRFHRSRWGTVLVLTDGEPPVKCRKLTREGELNDLERKWACDALMAIQGEGKHGDKYKKFFDFLEKLEMELEKKEREGTQSSGEGTTRTPIGADAPLPPKGEADGDTR